MLTVILTGGASRRMGRDKAMLPWEGGTLLQSLIGRYAALGPVAVSVNEPGRFAFTGARELVDCFPGQGPLNGIVSGFAETEAEELFLTATDLPFGDPALALRLSGLRAERGADACVLCRSVAGGGGVVAKGFEPTFAVYGRACLAPARAALERGRRAFFDLFGQISVRRVVPEELPEFSSHLAHILTNVNTQEEYEQCLNRLQQ